MGDDDTKAMLRDQFIAEVGRTISLMREAAKVMSIAADACEVVMSEYVERGASSPEARARMVAALDSVAPVFTKMVPTVQTLLKVSIPHIMGTRGGSA